ncbi:bifunctional molybdenum cofactor guanylyltransferase MobA/molybdopterin-guanine dinucleotide biosynthesis adaptor protein MobB [Geothermobacter hydrogeniphilus]|uniref:Probable molybdenum cofactor guanylyltransferase n=1 Tax=Geothermobacter hydrogeniphilus TaxID=1969733 RepID=A0A2K2HCF6_9BACT|nr:bifunctional molybdenum cofactor guanylyltransferase MobA/molybdopterin-guanine dinucleotide biosynthesis adaptor protein MobB [Geothermobacter hydrogeniphilus]PNU20986.1 bifunctional molybdenum cofactor guanylyltransferase MobA/molybdopterin-guanine dinucleotide biosynthesis adaptor protein MobB [Geothermobacter hydrogeniphilus]
MQNAHNGKTDSSDLTGVLLAGGRSLRMGRDKARLQIDGQPLYRRALDLLRHFCVRVLIAGDRPDLEGPDLPSVPDLYPGSALGGLYTGLRAAETDWILVAPCDMPRPDPAIVERMLALRQGRDAVVPRTPEGYEPVFALYHRNCLGQMEEMLRQDQYRIYDFYQRINIRYLDPPELPPGWQRSLVNLNTPEQLARFKDLQEGETAMTPPVVSVVAKSGTGKTTLLEKLIAELKQRGHRVAAIKHDAHSFSIDHEGKDSWRLTRAGADTMLITSPQQIAMVKQNPADKEPSLDETIATYCGDVDIILTEGFKRSSMPKIEVHRRARSEQLLCRGKEHDPTLIAVASDVRLELDVPCFDLNDAPAIVDFIEERFLR